MVKKALCVGCDYPSQNPGLSGAVNDCFLVADCLHRSCGFQPEDICILHDVIPGQAKSSERLVDPSRRPTRANILQRLRELARGARPGDVLLFSFSGYGLQVDDLRCNLGEGYDEAILPSDFSNGCNGDPAVILTEDIHDALMGIPQGCTLTVVMDCDHGTSVVDVSGTLDGRLVRGLKQNLCGVERHTTKMQFSEHRASVWEGSESTVAAQPRFQPMVEVANPGGGRVPTRQLMSRSTPVAFCYSAAGHGETALELQVTSNANGWEGVKQHGVLSWCFVQALEELRCDCTHSQLQAGIQRHMTRLKEECLPSMDQHVLLTFSLPLSDPKREKVLRPTAIREAARVAQAAPTHRPRNLGQQASFPQIVPPPPPGFLQKSSSCAVPLDAGYLPSPLASAGLSVLTAAWRGGGVTPPEEPVTREPTGDLGGSAPWWEAEEAAPLEPGASSRLPWAAPPRRMSAPAAPLQPAPARGETFHEEPPWELQVELQGGSPPPALWQAPAVASKSDSASTCSTRSRDDEAGSGSSESEDELAGSFQRLLPAGLSCWARRFLGAPRQQERGVLNLGLCPVPNQRPPPMAR